MNPVGASPGNLRLAVPDACAARSMFTAFKSPVALRAPSKMGDDPMRDYDFSWMWKELSFADLRS